MKINQVTYNSNNINFGAKTIKSKFFEPITKPYYNTMDKVETHLAQGILKILGTDTAKNIITKTKDTNLVSHLTALTGVILSGFYIEKTLKNDRLDEQRRKVLAINQAVVCALSTAGAYFVDKMLDKKIAKFTDKFMQVNAKEAPEALAKYKNGIRAASSIMIFGTIYRFISPVFATPIANRIGNHIQEKKGAERLAAKTKKEFKA